MSAHPLDNPIWQTLAHRHHEFALGGPGALRYPAAIAPFLGVEHAGTKTDAALAALVPPGDTVLLLGPRPCVPAGWTLEDFGPLVQMHCPQPLQEVPGPDFIELGDAQRQDLLDLTALVYPHYFRPQTPRLGRYFGIYENRQLAAIVGERMGPPGYREMSAICTHPDFLGRGYARRLTAWLANDILAQGMIPFLHVSPKNTRALELYQRLGFRDRARIEFASLRP